MDKIPISWLFWSLAGLLLCSAFFSVSETSMMALNRYRLKHLVKQGNRGARLTQALLDRTDRLLGVILLGNNLINSASSVLATVICVRRRCGESAARQEPHWQDRHSGGLFYPRHVPRHQARKGAGRSDRFTSPARQDRHRPDNSRARGNACRAPCWPRHPYRWHRQSWRD